MRQGEVNLTKALMKGLRRYEETGRGEDWLVECHNWAPAEGGLEPHDTLTSFGATGISWGGEGVYSPTGITRTITIRVTDYVDEEELSGVTVYIDGVSKGTTDANGELEITNVTVGGHELKMTKSGYLDSDADTLMNDYIHVI